jgi:tRNA/tmRNA/rRNA uracil-C5-methylase (TrmA/RlmC/RlmD family)
MNISFTTYFDTSIKVISSPLLNNYRNNTIFSLGQLIDNSISDIKSLNLVNDIYYKFPHLKGNIQIRNNNNLLMISIYSENDLTQVINFLDVESLYINNKLVKGNPYLKYNINNIILCIYPNSFFQVNTSLIAPMYDYINTLINNENLLMIGDDSGNLCVYLEKKSSIVLEYNIIFTKEIVLQAMEDNIRENNLDKTKFKLSVNNLPEYEFTTLIINPGRKGIKNYSEYINKSNFKRIIYMSCCPKTLKDDLKYLKNYKIKIMKGFDMMPNNEIYFETVSLFELI